MDTPKHFNIFYSWQSDLNRKANNYFIQDCLEKAIKQLNKDESISVIPRLDKDTEDKSGSPNIADTIFQKIDACQLFIADVTLINSSFIFKILKRRLSPNPNVLIELGYAVNRLSWERIICINNDAFSKVEDMPFDIKLNRISQYSFNGKTNKEKAKKALTAILKTAIKSIIDNYPQILSKQQEKNVLQHDIKIFQGLDGIINDTDLLFLLHEIANNQLLTNDEYRIIQKLVEYLNAGRNQFLVQEIISDANELAEAINTLLGTLAKNLLSRSEEYFDKVTGNSKRDIIYQLPQNEMYFDNYEAYEANREKRIDEITNSLSLVVEKYRIFRSTIKKRLFI